jgi:hypothetical protein
MWKEIAIALVVILIPILFAIYYFGYVKVPRVHVFGTEYSPGDEGKVFVQVLSDAYTPVDNAVCNLNVYYPDNTKFVNDEAMIGLGSRGMYFYNFIAPNTTGVYMIDIACKYPNFMVTYYPQESTALYAMDGVTYTITGTMNITFNTTIYSRFYGTFYGTFSKSTNYADIYVLKDNSWEYYCQITYYKPTCAKIVENYTGYSAVFKIVPMLGPKDKLDMDLANLIQYNTTEQVVTNLRGGGEIHVSYKKTVISDIDMPQARII